MKVASLSGLGQVLKYQESRISNGKVVAQKEKTIDIFQLCLNLAHQTPLVLRTAQWTIMLPLSPTSLVSHISPFTCKEDSSDSNDPSVLILIVFISERWESG